jgi:hypothetical protein
LLVNGTRAFQVQLVDDRLVGRKLNMTVLCAAPAGYFALLDDNGGTQIMTTLLGSCTATDHQSGGTVLQSSPSTLLERKEKIPKNSQWVLPSFSSAAKTMRVNPN